LKKEKAIANWSGNAEKESFHKRALLAFLWIEV